MILDFNWKSSRGAGQHVEGLHAAKEAYLNPPVRR
jgi:hypothetical protein